MLENKDVEVDFAEISREIEHLVKEIRDLKVRIAKTNNEIEVEVEGETIKIQELIILIGDLRSELSRLQYLKPRGPVYLGGQAVEYKPQKKQDEIANLISMFEEKKAEVDKILQAKNWSAELQE